MYSTFLEEESRMFMKEDIYLLFYVKLFPIQIIIVKYTHMKMTPEKYHHMFIFFLVAPNYVYVFAIILIFRQILRVADVNHEHIDCILPKGPYPLCLHMADRPLLAGYPPYEAIFSAIFWIDQLPLIKHPHQGNHVMCGIIAFPEEPGIFGRQWQLWPSTHAIGSNHFNDTMSGYISRLSWHYLIVWHPFLVAEINLYQGKNWWVHPLFC